MRVRAGSVLALDSENGRALESLDGSARGGRKKKKKKKVQLGLDEGTAGAFERRTPRACSRLSLCSNVLLRFLLLVEKSKPLRCFELGVRGCYCLWLTHWVGPEELDNSGQSLSNPRLRLRRILLRCLFGFLPARGKKVDFTCQR